MRFIGTTPTSLWQPKTSRRCSPTGKRIRRCFSPSGRFDPERLQHGPYDRADDRQARQELAGAVLMIEMQADKPVLADMDLAYPFQPQIGVRPAPDAAAHPPAQIGALFALIR